MNQDGSQQPLASILVVDDDPLVLRATVRVLRKAGYEVSETVHSRKCLDLVFQQKPDLILLDVDMPAPDGFTLCQQLKANPEWAAIFVVLISGQKRQSDHLEQGLEGSGADGYICRPVSNPVLLARIHSFVRIQNLQRERDQALEAARQTQALLLELQRSETDRIHRELDRMRDELVRKTRLATIGQLSASISHDLRSPLAAMHNAMHLLKSYLPEPEEKLSRQLQVLDREIRHSNQIISSLLDVARDRPAAKQGLSLNQLVQRVIKETCIPQGVRCVCTTDPDPFVVYADPAQLRQVIQNLLANAVEAMGDTGAFIVQASEEGSEQVIRFRDTGPGFPCEIKGDLLDPLATTKITGTGLRLAICRDTVIRHGGDLVVEKNTEPGAVIRITLPHTPDMISQ